MTYQLTSDVLKADETTIRALEHIAGYAPTHPDHSLEAIQRLDGETQQAGATVKQLLHAIERLQHELAVARHTERTLQMKRHRVVVAIRQAVKLQYGDDSWQVQVIGLTKKSDRKRPKRRPRSDDAIRQ